MNAADQIGATEHGQIANDSLTVGSPLVGRYLTVRVFSGTFEAEHISDFALRRVDRIDARDRDLRRDAVARDQDVQTCLRAVRDLGICGASGQDREVEKTRHGPRLDEEPVRAPVLFDHPRFPQAVPEPQREPLKLDFVAVVVRAGGREGARRRRRPRPSVPRGELDSPRSGKAG